MYHMYIRHKQFAKKITLHFGLIADILFDILSYLYFSMDKPVSKNY